MLAQTLFVIAMFAIVASSAIAGIAGTARGQSAGAARALIVPAIETALGRYQREIAGTIAAQIPAPAGTLTAAPATIPALNGTTPWVERQYVEAPDTSTLRVAVDVKPTARSVPACSAADTGPDVAAELQCSPFVQESRLSLSVVADAGPIDATGAVSALAHARYALTLRLFAQPPYVIVSGVEGAADPGGYHEADMAGWGGALPPFASPAPDDTTIHVLYVCTPGLGTCASSNPVPQDAPTALPWTNGNGRP